MATSSEPSTYAAPAAAAASGPWRSASYGAISAMRPPLTRIRTFSWRVGSNPSHIPPALIHRSPSPRAGAQVRGTAISRLPEPSMFTERSWPADMYSTERESGAQVGISATWSVSWRAGPVGVPSVATGSTWSTEFMVKAIQAPSGDHAGPASKRSESCAGKGPGSWRVASPVATSTTRIRFRPSRKRPENGWISASTMKRPSGDQDGFPTLLA